MRRNGSTAGSLTSQIACLILLAMGVGGCASRTQRVEVTAEPVTQPAAQRPYFLIHLPGIGGLARFDDWMVDGLQEGGIDADLFMYNWVGKNIGFKALMQYDRNRELAAELSKRIIAINEQFPEQKIVLSAHSAGNALLIWALEDLPPQVHVESILMLSPALSPQYDLSNALTHVRRGAYVFYSHDDNVVLGAGTSIFGTADGVKTAAAGMVGFEKPESADEMQYKKLHQFAHDEGWKQWGNGGGHLDPMSREFARQVLAPLLLNGKLEPTTQVTHAP